jgi:hypothetical protein
LNPVYRGDVVYGRTREKKVRANGCVKRRKVKVPKDEWDIARNQHEALVDEVTWRAVQDRFARNKQKGAGLASACGGRKPASVLSGLIRCGACGRNFVIWVSGPNSKQRKRGTGRRNRRCCCNWQRESRGRLCGNKVTVDADVLERATFDALEKIILTPEGLADLEAQRATLLREALRESDKDAKRLRAESSRLQQAEARILDAIKAGLPLDGLRAEAEQIAGRREQIRHRLERLDALEDASERRVDDYLKANPVKHFREVLDAPDLDEVRTVLKELTVSIDARADGSFWLLIGEGPLGSDDLALIPPNDDGGGHRAPAPESSGRSTTSAAKYTATPGEPGGPARGSRICMVGATGIEPATS